MKRKSREATYEYFKDIHMFSERSLKKIWDNPDDEIWSEYLIK
jgi:predicted HD phosphohydrolase